MITATEHIAPEDLMTFADNELPAAERHSVEDHLATCGACATALATLRVEKLTFQKWTVEPIPVRVETRMLQSLEDRTSGLKPSEDRRAPLWMRGGWMWGGSGALAAGALAIALFMTSHKESTKHRTESIALVEPGPEDGIPGAAPVKSARAGTRQAQMVLPPPAPAPAAVAGIARGSRMAPSVDEKMARNSGQSAAIVPKEITAPMIARSVDLTLTVKDIDHSRDALDSLLRAYGAYAAQMEVSTPDDGSRTLTASLRVPANQARGFVAELKGFGKLENETQTGEEVGEQHADLAARLNTSRESEERLRAILKTRTGDVSEVLEVEQEIARVRTEIETMEAEQQGLEHRVSYTTVDLHLNEPGDAPTAETVSSRLVQGAQQGWQNATGALLSLVLFLLRYALAVVLVAAVLLVPGILLWKRWKRVRSRW